MCLRLFIVVMMFDVNLCFYGDFCFEIWLLLLVVLVKFMEMFVLIEVVKFIRNVVYVFCVVKVVVNIGVKVDMELFIRFVKLG